MPMLRKPVCGRSLESFRDRVKQHAPRHVVNDETKKMLVCLRIPKKKKKTGVLKWWLFPVTSHSAAKGECRAGYSDFIKWEK